MTPIEDEFKKKVGKLFKSQEKDVLSKIDSVTISDPKAQVDVWMFGRKTWEKRFRDVGKELIKTAVFVNGLRDILMAQNSVREMFSTETMFYQLRLDLKKISR